MNGGEIRIGGTLPGAGNRAPRRVADGDPFRIFVVGDFGGRGRTRRLETGSALDDRSSLAVDRDRFAGVLRRLAPRLELAAGLEQPVELSVDSLDCFSPDWLYARLDLFRDLRQGRARLLDPSAAAAAPAQPDAALASKSDKGAGAESDAETLKRLLGSSRPVPTQPAATPASAELSALLKEIVAPHIQPDASANRHLVSAIDQAAAERMRRVLHDPAFQELESLWRSLHGLVSRLDLDAGVELRILDLAKTELLALLQRANLDPEASALLRRLSGSDPADAARHPYAALVCGYAFDSSGSDFALIAALGSLAQSAGGVMLGAAPRGLWGFPSFGEAPPPSAWTELQGETGQLWRALRSEPSARSIGLVAPRLLLRLPYGPRTEPVTSFEFDEASTGMQHESFLWGNPAFGCAELLATSYLDAGWDMEPEDGSMLEGLPAHVFEEDGEKKLLPCAETYLSERALDLMLRAGVMPWISLPGRDAVRLARFRSISDASPALAGPWTAR